MSKLKKIVLVTFSFYLSAYLLTFGQGQGEGGEQITLPNPLGASSVMEVIQNIINALTIYIAPPIVAGMVLYGAFQILFAGANPDKFGEGKKTILYAAVGYAIILIANGITLVIHSLLSG